MALVSANISASIISASPYQGSQVIPRIAQAVGTSISQWISLPTNVLVQGNTSGFVGSGTVQGTLTFVTSGQMMLAFQNNSLSGQAAPGIAAAIENGLASSLQSAQYVGSSAAVGVGSDVSRIIVSNSGSLISILVGNLAGVSVSGQSSTTLATAIAQGVSEIIRTGIGVGTVTGVGGNISATGISISTVF